MALILHQVIVQRSTNSPEVGRWNFTDWEDALFVAEAAKTFKLPMVWWYRYGADKPWMMRQRFQLSPTQIKDPAGPFCHPGPDLLDTTGPMRQGGGANPRRTRSTPSEPSGSGVETGPGLEKP